MTAAVIVPLTEDAVRQWTAVREALPVQVLLAEIALVQPRSGRPAVHILARADLIRYGRVITGVDGEYILSGEACFCASEKTIGKLQFEVWKARHQQHLYPVPTCATCLRLCHSVTKLPVDQIRGKRP